MIFMRLLKEEMKLAKVDQPELARRMGDGIKQPHISRWLSDDGPKMQAARFATAINALGGNVVDVFTAGVAEARAAGLFKPAIEGPERRVTNLADERERREAQLDWMLEHAEPRAAFDDPTLP